MEDRSMAPEQPPGYRMSVARALGGPLCPGCSWVALAGAVLLAGVRMGVVPAVAAWLPETPHTRCAAAGTLQPVV